jgi:hypothetical protein
MQPPERNRMQVVTRSKGTRATVSIVSLLVSEVRHIAVPFSIKTKFRDYRISSV